MPSCVQDTLVSIHSALRFPANQLAPGPGTLVVLAPPCGSWGRVCRGTSMRSILNPLGCAFEFVHQANLTISRSDQIGIGLGSRLGLLTPHPKYVGLFQGTNISHLGKNNIFKIPFLGDMLVPWRVYAIQCWVVKLIKHPRVTPCDL